MKSIIIVSYIILLTLVSNATDNLTPLEVNRDKLVEMAVLGEISPPVLADPPYRVSPDGKIIATPATGSITYNFRTGDSAVRMAGDHVEPAVSIVNFGSTNSRNSPENIALNTLSCVGNAVTVISGDAKGAKGTVIGKHGGIENVMVEFPDEVYERLSIGDIVAIIDADHRHGRIYRGGAVTIGVVVHGVSVLAGHGPGVTTLITSPGGNIDVVIDPDANLARLLELRQ